MLKIRGKIHGKDYFSEISLDKGELSGDMPLVLLVKRLSTEYEDYGVVPVLNYTPEVDEYWKDENALLYMVDAICTNIQTNQRVTPLPEVEEGKDY